MAKVPPSRIVKALQAKRDADWRLMVITESKTLREAVLKGLEAERKLRETSSFGPRSLGSGNYETPRGPVRVVRGGLPSLGRRHR